MKVYQARISFVLLTFIRLAALEASHEGGASPLANGEWFAESAEKAPVYADKEITFDSNYGATSNRNKKKGRLDCDWDHPQKVKHCPPVAASPFVGGGGPPGAPPEDDVNCLRTPNHSLCRILQSDTETVATSGTSRTLVNGNTTDETVMISNNATQDLSENEDTTNSFVAEFPVAFVATEAPTRDDCYGNMFDGRFCASSMPSVLEEPTKEPKLIPSRGKLKEPTPTGIGIDSGGAKIPSEDDSNADHGGANVPPGHNDRGGSEVPPQSTPEPSTYSSGVSNEPTASPSDSFKYDRGGAKLPTFALPEPSASPSTDPTHGPTPFPSPTPTSAPTRCEDRVAGTLERHHGSEVCVEASLAVTTVSRTHDSVSFSVKQVFTQSALTWIATQYVGINGIAVCDTQKYLPVGQSLTYTAACDENFWALINIYVHDETAKAAANVPGECSVDSIEGVVCAYTIQLLCDCSGISLSPRSPTSSTSSKPSGENTGISSLHPTATRSDEPTLSLSAIPTAKMSAFPSSPPILARSSRPSETPSTFPRTSLSASPTSDPSAASNQPSSVPTRDLANRMSSSPTSRPTIPDGFSTISSSESPSGAPTGYTQHSSSSPSIFSSDSPSDSPTSGPSYELVKLASGEPTYDPSAFQSALPSVGPTLKPSQQPTITPTDDFSSTPTLLHAIDPSIEPSENGIPEIITLPPLLVPTGAPTKLPSSFPSSEPSVTFSASPSAIPSSASSETPSVTPSGEQTEIPSTRPSSGPWTEPGFNPSRFPADLPSAQPTSGPSNLPSSYHSDNPTGATTQQPSSNPRRPQSAEPLAFNPRSPTDQQSASPTEEATTSLSEKPLSGPSNSPNAKPSFSPSSPSSNPSIYSSDTPTIGLTAEPSPIKSDAPSDVPTSSKITGFESTFSPSVLPSSSSIEEKPTDPPHETSSDNPRATPSSISSEPTSSLEAPTSSVPKVISRSPSASSIASGKPTTSSSDEPSVRPSTRPSDITTFKPTFQGGSAPSEVPSSSPSQTIQPSGEPTMSSSAAPSVRPSSFPSVKVCEDYERITFNEDGFGNPIAAGSFVSFQWMNYGFKLKALPRSDSSGGYLENGWPRVFDTSNPGTVITGTPSLAGDFGNVLIVQQQRDKGEVKWQANDSGGVIVFEFEADPRGEIIDIGLHNVVENAQIRVEKKQGVVTEFDVAAQGESVPVIQSLNVFDVKKVEVIMKGPSAVTFLGICYDNEGRSSTKIPGNLWPTEQPSVPPSQSPAPSQFPTTSPVPSMIPSSVPTAEGETAPSESPSTFPTVTFAPTSVSSQVPSMSPTISPSFMDSNAPSAEPSYSPTALPTSNPSTSPSDGPNAVPSMLPSGTPSLSPTYLPSLAPASSPSGAPSNLPSVVPTVDASTPPSLTPTIAPTSTPSSLPSFIPSSSPVNEPSSNPTIALSLSPSVTLSLSPSEAPSSIPSIYPSGAPSPRPSEEPSSLPSIAPILLPSTVPSLIPTIEPSSLPSAFPSTIPTEEGEKAPSEVPSSTPTESPVPSSTPTQTTSAIPSPEPTGVPIFSPSGAPSTSLSASPSFLPSFSPSSSPIVTLSEPPSGTPSERPSIQLSTEPSLTPTMVLSLFPSSAPSSKPTDEQSVNPTMESSANPSAEPSVVPSVTPSTSSSGASLFPSNRPSSLLSLSPTAVPTQEGEKAPSEVPSDAPTESLAPSSAPTQPQSEEPNVAPTGSASDIPSQRPTSTPTNPEDPSSAPSDRTTSFPSSSSTPPSFGPSSLPSVTPSNIPSSGPISVDSVEPSIFPSSSSSLLPTTIPSTSPLSSVPSIEPTQPVSSLGDPICVQIARLEDISIAPDGSGMYTENPISVYKQTGSTVSFVVEQNWKDVGSIRAVSVAYEDVDERMQCPQSVNVAEQSPMYTAHCVDGVAEVAVFVSDDSFSGLTDISDRIPASCTNSSADFAMFMFSVPCQSNSEAFCAEKTLCPETSSSDLPSSAPSKAPSEIKSTKRSESLSKAPSDLKSVELSVSPNSGMPRTFKDPICVQKVQLHGTSSKKNGPFMYSSMPIRIRSQKDTAVTFSIKNTWTADDDGSLDNINAVFEGTDKVMVCSQSTDVVDSTQELTALCADGVADLVLFVTDASFQGAEKITDNIPSFCESTDEDTVMFAFRIPCDAADESFCDENSLCPETEALDTVSASLVSCQQEARLDSDSTDKGKLGMYESNPIVIVDQQSKSVSFKVKQSWNTPDRTLGAMSIYYEGYYEGSNDETMVCDEITNIDPESPLYTAQCVDGIAEIALFVRDGSFPGLMDVSTTIPTICSNARESPVGKLAVFFFTIPCDSSDTSFCISSDAGVDNSGPISRQMRDDKEDHILITSNEIRCRTIHEETFESVGDALSWEGGIESSTEAFGNFLGRFGSDNPVVHKTFQMPVEASSATIRFKLYVINGGSIEDTLQLGIQNSWVDIQLTMKEMQYHQDEAITLRDRSYDRFSFISASQGDNSTYDIEIVVPKRWWVNHNKDLPFGFRVITQNDMNEDGYGIDDFTIEVDCGTQRRTKGLSQDDSPQLEPSEEGDEASSYCRSADYPCAEGNDMVNVCHYSSRQGYQTFCIPEQDSEVLRFYRSDYCGPCAYAFGKVSVE